MISSIEVQAQQNQFVDDVMHTEHLRLNKTICQVLSLGTSYLNALNIKPAWETMRAILQIYAIYRRVVTWAIHVGYH